MPTIVETTTRTRAPDPELAPITLASAQTTSVITSADNPMRQRLANTMCSGKAGSL